ncbi:MAG: efflux RND transporter permease subunit [bacterium]|nr:efflux RND transporter permease subunit [bacterium]
MRDTFTRRPVLAIVISIVVVLLGAIAMVRLPVALFPNVAPPEVNVTVEYTGASAETVAKAAVFKLERAINGVPGMKYMSSDMGNDGVGIVQVLFQTGTDPDVAAINVQNRVNAVMGELPAEVIRNGVKIAKEENAMLLYFSITSSNPEHDQKFLYNFADLNVLAELKRIPGVGYADILGAKEYAMRIWLKPDRMQAYQVAAEDVLTALEAYNVEAAPGKIGENSDRGHTPLQYTITYAGKFGSEAQYGDIPLRATADGQILRIKDVAEVEFGTTYFDVEAKFDGRPAAAILLKQLPGSNATDVVAAVKQRLAELKAEVFLPGMDYHFSVDVSRFLDAALAEVARTFAEAFVLVAIVVFVFLQDWRTTLIPALAVPVALIGTFLFLQLLGFSLNLVTLFALVLAIGIVVDNAIVVVEAVHATMEREGLGPRAATERAMGEVGGAIVAITLVMASVFLPMAFISGPAGIFYRQFALTIAVAITLSGMVALTLAPALCSVIMRHRDRTAAHGGGRLRRGFAWFDRTYARIEDRSCDLVGRVARHRLATTAMLGAFLVGAGVVSIMVPRGFIPTEDQSYFYGNVTTPPGATLERTKQVMDAIEQAGRGVEGVESIATLAGTNVLSDGTGASYGTVLVNLRPWHERARSVVEVMADVEARTRDITGAEIEYFQPPPIPGYGNAGGFEARVLDKTGTGDLPRMDEVVKGFVRDLEANPQIASAFTIFDASYPQYAVQIDMDKAAQKGVTMQNALGTLQTLLGSEYATNFIRFGQMYKVMVQAEPEQRAVPEDLLRLQVRGAHGDMVPLAAFATLQKTYGVDQLTRYNMYPSAEVNGEGRPGVSSRRVLEAVQETARATLPRGYAIDWAGISRDEINAGEQGLVIFWICLVFVYLVLAAQYESFLLPLVVVLSLPPGVFGAFLGLQLAGLDNDIYAHMALVVLIGLLGKNAILIVEFAEHRRRDGAEALAAVLDATRLRLRPILMTSLAFFAGLLPLAMATGAGAVGNRTVGTAAAAGMLLGTVFGVVLVPGLYVLVQRFAAWLSAPAAAPAHEGRESHEGLARPVEPLRT